MLGLALKGRGGMGLGVFALTAWSLGMKLSVGMKLVALCA